MSLPANRFGRIAGAAGGLLLCAALLSACDDYTPEPVPDAVIQLAFEGDLDNTAPLALTGEALDSSAGYAGGKTGKALKTRGEGGWIEIRPEEPVALRGSVEVSFDFKRAFWTNPYRAGSGSQTMVHLRGRSPDKIVHLTFNIWPGPQPTLVATIEGRDGDSHRLRTQNMPVTLDWHSVRLAFDAETRSVTLFFDDQLVESVQTVPAVYAAGVDMVKFGTWHKRNQAYKGLIDNFIIRNVDG